MAQARNGDLGKGDWLRCINCGTRRRTIQLMTGHMQRHPECAPCTCGGYHYPHRRGTTYCDHNPFGAVNRASRAGASDEDVATLRARIVEERECPF